MSSTNFRILYVYTYIHIKFKFIYISLRQEPYFIYLQTNDIWQCFYRDYKYWLNYLVKWGHNSLSTNIMVDQSLLNLTCWWFHGNRYPWFGWPPWAWWIARSPRTPWNFFYYSWIPHHTSQPDNRCTTVPTGNCPDLWRLFSLICTRK